MSDRGGDDWQAGDLALCIKLGAWRHAASGMPGPATIRAGMILTVRRVGTCPITGLLTLWFVGYPGERGMDGFGACRFIKITPKEADEYDQEIIHLMTTTPQPVEV